MYLGESQVTLSDTSKDYYLQRAYNPKSGRFYNLSQSEHNKKYSNTLECNMCSICKNNNEKPQGFSIKDKDSSKIIGKYISVKDIKYWIGNFVYLKPRSLCHMYPQIKRSKLIYF